MINNNNSENIISTTCEQDIACREFTLARDHQRHVGLLDDLAQALDAGLELYAAGRKYMLVASLLAKGLLTAPVSFSLGLPPV